MGDDVRAMPTQRAAEKRNDAAVVRVLPAAPAPSERPGMRQVDVHLGLRTNDEVDEPLTGVKAVYEKCPVSQWIDRCVGDDAVIAVQVP